MIIQMQNIRLDSKPTGLPMGMTIYSHWAWMMSQDCLWKWDWLIFSLFLLHPMGAAPSLALHFLRKSVSRMRRELNFLPIHTPGASQREAVFTYPWPLHCTSVGDCLQQKIKKSRKTTHVQGQVVFFFPPQDNGILFY